MRCMIILLKSLGDNENFKSSLRSVMAKSPYIPKLTVEEYERMIDAIMESVILVVMKRVLDGNTTDI